MHSSRCRQWQTETFYAARGGEQKEIQPSQSPTDHVSTGTTLARSQAVIVSINPDFDHLGPTAAVVTLIYEGDTANNPRRWSCVVIGTKRIIPSDPVQDVTVLGAGGYLNIESKSDNEPVTGVDE